MRQRSNPSWCLIPSVSRSILTLSVAALLVTVVLPAAAPGALQAPDWISINEFRGGINLRWFRVQGAVHYLVQRRAGESGQYRTLARVSNPVYDDFMASAGQLYFYRIVPLDGEGAAGPPSVERFFEIPPAEPGLLAPPMWSTHHFLPDGIALAWDHPDSDHVLAYNLYRRGPGESTFTLLTSSMDINYLDRNVAQAQAYQYVVTALNRQLQESDVSQTLTVTFTLQEKGPEAGGRLRDIKTLEEVVVATEAAGSFSWQEYGFVSPVDVEFSPAYERYYVSDAGTGLVTVIDYQGDVIHRLGGSGGLPHQFERLLGIALGPSGTLYAVDAYRGDVVVFSPQGHFQRRIRLGPEVTEYFGQDMMIRFPWFRFGLVDLASGPDGSLLVVDNPNGWIYLLDGRDDLVKVISERGYGEGQMQYPTFAAFDGMGGLVVADTMNSRVQRFDGTDLYSGTIGGPGLGIGQFMRPKGVIADPRGYLYVADSFLNVIQVFDPEGQFAALLGDENGLPLDLGSPNGLAFVPPDRIAVCEKLGRRVQIRRIPLDILAGIRGR